MAYHYKHAALIFLGLSSAQVSAGEHQDRLAQCLIQSTTQDDRNLLVQWMFTAMSAHPLTSELATVPAPKRKAITAGATVVFEKLLTDTCGRETLETMKYEGTESLSKAFEALGSVAMQGLMGHPDVEKAINDMASGIDEAKFQTMIDKYGR